MKIKVPPLICQGQLYLSKAKSLDAGDLRNDDNYGSSEFVGFKDDLDDIEGGGFVERRMTDMDALKNTREGYWIKLGGDNHLRQAGKDFRNIRRETKKRH